MEPYVTTKTKTPEVGASSATQHVSFVLVLDVEADTLTYAQPERSRQGNKRED